MFSLLETAKAANDEKAAASKGGIGGGMGGMGAIAGSMGGGFTGGVGPAPIGSRVIMPAPGDPRSWGVLTD